MSGVDKNTISNIKYTRSVLGLLGAIIVLSIDTLNPIKLFLHVLHTQLHCEGVSAWHIAAIATLCVIYITISEFKELLYFAAKIFINSMLSIFFRDIEVLGKDKLPRHGPMIFVINHANQFVDAMVVLGTTSSENFKVSYLMAEKSLKRPVIGDIASALDVVPVKRSQDEPIRGNGTIVFHDYVDEEGDKSDTTTTTATKEGEEKVGYTDEGDATSATTATTEKEGARDTNGDNDDGKDVEETVTAAVVRKLKVTGSNYHGTEFELFTTSVLRVGDKIRPNGTPTAVKVIEIIDDRTCIVDVTLVSQQDRETIFQTTTDTNATTNATNVGIHYDILKHVDLHSMFEKVLDKLAMGGVFGIFPEGGSHDRTDLLPLKVGVALIAYSALERDGVSVPIVPVGLNYFRTHRWRGKCLVEYGNPVYIDPASLSEYQKGGTSKRVVCNDLLSRIKDSMKSVIVTMPDYDSLQVVHTARRLYQNEIAGGDKIKQQDLLRRFALGYKTLMNQHNTATTTTTGDAAATGGDTSNAAATNTTDVVPQAWLDLQERIKAYRRELKELGLRDYQVPGLDRGKENTEYMNRERIFRGIRVIYQIVHILVLVILSAIPNLFLNLPIRLLADVYAEHRRQKALANSKVKIHGYDVMLTEKLTFCIVMVPILWLLYGLIMVFFTNFDAQTITLCFMCFPVFSYAAIIYSEAGMVDGKDLKPYFLRLLPSTRKRLRALPKQRRQLRIDLRLFVKKVGPAFGELYHAPKVDFKQVHDTITKNRHTIMRKAVSTDDFYDIANDIVADDDVTAAAAAAAEEHQKEQEETTKNDDPSSTTKKDQ